MTLILSFALLLAPAAAAWGQGSGDDWDDKAVEGAISRAIEHLWSQWKDGHWDDGADADVGGHRGANQGGRTALCTYALLAAGVSPQDPKMVKTLEWLAAVDMKGTYAVGLRANVWAMLGRDSKYRTNLAKDARYLVLGVDGRGGYDYVPIGNQNPSSADPKNRPVGRYDNSNSQLAVLGVWAAEKSGFEVPIGYWQLIEKHWADDQQADGGWCYQEKGNSYGSMSAAGLATAFICFDALYRERFVSCDVETDYKPIVRGLEWMDKNFSPTGNPGHGSNWYYYYLYGVERVGLASGYKYFGQKDWYKLGTTTLLSRQGNGGGWGSVAETSFALLFLARGRHPVLFNKLKYTGTWNSRPRDLANFTTWVSAKFERPVNWQIIHLGVPVRELHDAPILYISGASAPAFSDEDVAKLRAFVEQGGVIFSEAACNRAAFTLAMEKVYARMFPAYEMKRLTDDHPIYNLHYKIAGADRSLSGLSNGVRLLAVHAPAEVSLALQLNNTSTQGPIFELASNLYFFVTDKGILPPRGVSRWPAARQFTPAETVKLVRVKYEGNWDPEPGALPRFATLMGNLHRVKVELGPPRTMEQLNAAETPVAVLTGTSAVEFSETARAGLAKYLKDGGTLIADAGGGSEAFATAFEKQIQGLLPGARYGVIPSVHSMYEKAGPKIERVRYRRALRAILKDTQRPRLRGLLHNERLAVIFSPDDLTAGLVGCPVWGLSGYEPESAFELMRNAVLFASGKSIGGE